jgi:hypothetical protein
MAEMPWTSLKFDAVVMVMCKVASNKEQEPFAALALCKTSGKDNKFEEVEPAGDLKTGVVAVESIASLISEYTTVLAVTELLVPSGHQIVSAQRLDALIASANVHIAHISAMRTEFRDPTAASWAIIRPI